MTQKLFFILITLSISCFSTLQSQCYQLTDSVVYSNAYNYIVADSLFSGKSVNVSNKLTGTCYICFFNELKGENDPTIFYEKLSKLDEKYAINGSSNEHFKKWFVEYEESEIRLFFSEITNRELFAEIQIGNFGINSLGEKVFYYFTFYLDGDIESVRKKVMHGL